MAGDRMKNANHSHVTEQLSGPWQCHWAQPSLLSLQELPIADRASGQQRRRRRSGRREEDSRSRWKSSEVRARSGLPVSPEASASALFHFASHGFVSFQPSSTEAPCDETRCNGVGLGVESTHESVTLIRIRCAALYLFNFLDIRKNIK